MFWKSALQILKKVYSKVSDTGLRASGNIYVPVLLAIG